MGVREAANLLVAHPSGDGAGPQPQRLASGDRGGEEHSLAALVAVARDLTLVVDQPAGAKQLLHAFAHPVHHELRLGAGRRGSGVDHGGVRLVDSAEHERVEVQVRVQRSTPGSEPNVCSNATAPPRPTARPVASR